VIREAEKEKEGRVMFLGGQRKRGRERKAEREKGGEERKKGKTDKGERKKGIERIVKSYGEHVRTLLFHNEKY
jgi:hypothetical protein